MTPTVRAVQIVGFLGALVTAALGIATLVTRQDTYQAWSLLPAVVSLICVAVVVRDQHRCRRARARR